MNRLDFSSVLAVIRYYISPDHGMNQGELLDELFYSLHAMCPMLHFGFFMHYMIQKMA